MPCLNNQGAPPPVLFDNSGSTTPAGSTGGVVAINPATGAIAISTPTSQFATKVGVQQETYVSGTDTGAANAYVVANISPVPTIVLYSEVVFQAVHGNTGPSTIQVTTSSGNVTFPITKNGTVALAGGEISAHQIVRLKYDGANMQIVSGAEKATRQGFIQYDLRGKPPAGSLTSSAAGAVTFAPIAGNLTIFQIPANFSGGFGKAGTNPTTTAVYNFYKNGSSIGTLSISTTGVFTWATSGGTPVSFTPATDELAWIPPATQDATLSDVRFAIPVMIA